ncbi:hypothetical protein [Sutcliffiella horikoshii]|uniref:Uncharacterized protein n=1 Tax=Sutcliffiella horikoshii TaxID=79883 RepID=A0A5D4TAP2_9BACI|nr:hypothetical protein [Sutcliffiella horikoshii]TYS72359.1 hypothetical protein FZC75_10415 [Sutcliffiella horikoshii]
METTYVDNLIKYGMFSVSDGAEISRTELHEWLIEYILVFKNMPLTKEELSKYCKELLDLESDFPIEHIQKGIELAISNKHINVIQEESVEKYIINDERTKKISQYQVEFNKQQEGFNSFIKDSINNSIGRDIEQALIDEIILLLKTELIKKFQSLSISAAEMFVNRSLNIQNGEGDIFNDRLRGLLNKSSDLFELEKEKIIESINNTLTNFPSEQTLYLHSLLSNLYNCQILKLDPSIDKFEKNLLKDRLVYLDTNVLVAYIFKSHNMHNFVSNIIKSSKDIGMKFYILERTKEEFSHLFKRANKRYESHIKGKPQNLTYFKSANDPVILEFVTLDDVANWELFMSLFSDIEKLLGDYDIKIKEVDIDKKEEEYLKVLNTLEDIKQQNSYHLIPLDKLEKICEHDTALFVSLHKERETSDGDILGSKVWGLTLDNTLKRIQYNPEIKHQFNKPILRSPDEWATMLMSFKNPQIKDQSNENYLLFLVNSIVNMSPAVINANVFDLLGKLKLPMHEVMTGMNVNEKLTIRLLNKIAEDKEMKELAERAEEEGNEVLVTEIHSKFFDRITTIAEKNQENEVIIESQTRELGELKEALNVNVNEKEKLEVKSETLEQQIEQLSMLQKEQLQNFQKQLDEIKSQNTKQVKQKNYLITFLVTITLILISFWLLI